MDEVQKKKIVSVCSTPSSKPYTVLCAGCVKLLAKVSEIFSLSLFLRARTHTHMHACIWVFYLIIKMVYFRGPNRWKSEGNKLGLQGKWGLDSSLLLAEPIEFFVLTSLMSAHITLNWFWLLSARIPLTRYLLCPKRH
jgi:hypothetical protein